MKTEKDATSTPFNYLPPQTRPHFLSGSFTTAITTDEATTETSSTTSTTSIKHTTHHGLFSFDPTLQLLAIALPDGNIQLITNTFEYTLQNLYHPDIPQDDVNRKTSREEPSCYQLNVQHTHISFVTGGGWLVTCGKLIQSNAFHLLEAIYERREPSLDYASATDSVYTEDEVDQEKHIGRYVLQTWDLKKLTSNTSNHYTPTTLFLKFDVTSVSRFHVDTSLKVQHPPTTNAARYRTKHLPSVVSPPIYGNPNDDNRWLYYIGSSAGDLFVFDGYNSIFIGDPIPYHQSVLPALTTARSTKRGAFNLHRLTLLKGHPQNEALILMGFDSGALSLWSFKLNKSICTYTLLENEMKKKGEKLMSTLLKKKPNDSTSIVQQEKMVDILAVCWHTEGQRFVVLIRTTQGDVIKHDLIFFGVNSGLPLLRMNLEVLLGVEFKYGLKVPFIHWERHHRNEGGSTTKVPPTGGFSTVSSTKNGTLYLLATPELEGAAYQLFGGYINQLNGSSQPYTLWSIKGPSWNEATPLVLPCYGQSNDRYPIVTSAVLVTPSFPLKNDSSTGMRADKEVGDEGGWGCLVGGLEMVDDMEIDRGESAEQLMAKLEHIMQFIKCSSFIMVGITMIQNDCYNHFVTVHSIPKFYCICIQVNQLLFEKYLEDKKATDTDERDKLEGSSNGGSACSSPPIPSLDPWDSMRDPLVFQLNWQSLSLQSMTCSQLLMKEPYESGYNSDAESDYRGVTSKSDMNVTKLSDAALDSFVDVLYTLRLHHNLYDWIAGFSGIPPAIEPTLHYNQLTLSSKSNDEDEANVTQLRSPLHLSEMVFFGDLTRVSTSSYDRESGTFKGIWVTGHEDGRVHLYAVYDGGVLLLHTLSVFSGVQQKGVFCIDSIHSQPITPLETTDYSVKCVSLYIENSEADKMREYFSQKDMVSRNERYLSVGLQSGSILVFKWNGDSMQMSSSEIDCFKKYVSRSTSLLGRKEGDVQEEGGDMKEGIGSLRGLNYSESTFDELLTKKMRWKVPVGLHCQYRNVLHTASICCFQFMRYPIFGRQSSTESGGNVINWKLHLIAGDVSGFVSILDITNGVCLNYLDINEYISPSSSIPSYITNLQLYTTAIHFKSKQKYNDEEELQVIKSDLTAVCLCVLSNNYILQLDMETMSVLRDGFMFEDDTSAYCTPSSVGWKSCKDLVLFTPLRVVPYGEVTSENEGISRISWNRIIPSIFGNKNRGNKDCGRKVSSGSIRCSEDDGENVPTWILMVTREWVGFIEGRVEAMTTVVQDGNADTTGRKRVLNALNYVSFQAHPVEHTPIIRSTVFYSHNIPYIVLLGGDNTFSIYTFECINKVMSLNCVYQSMEGSFGLGWELHDRLEDTDMTVEMTSSSNEAKTKYSRVHHPVSTDGQLLISIKKLNGDIRSSNRVDTNSVLYHSMLMHMTSTRMINNELVRPYNEESVSMRILEHRRSIAWSVLNLSHHRRAMQWKASASALSQPKQRSAFFGGFLKLALSYVEKPDGNVSVKSKDEVVDIRVLLTQSKIRGDHALLEAQKQGRADGSIGSFIEGRLGGRLSTAVKNSGGSRSRSRSQLSNNPINNTIFDIPIKPYDDYTTPIKLEDLKNKLVGRGEQLNSLSNASDALASEAAGFAKLANQLAKK